MRSLEISGLHKAFGSQRVLRGLDLEVSAGSLMAVLGASGGGKTTLLRIVVGLEPPDAGLISLGGQVVDDADRHMPPEARKVGYVPQEGALFPHLSVAANIGFGLRGSRARRARVDEMLELVGLTGLAQRRPDQLSGGQQQRVALARALAPDPTMVLLDEPFSSLDASLRATVRADVKEVLEASGTTALLVTHDQDEALSLADVVAIMRGGRIVQSDTPANLYRQPVDSRVASFVGTANVLVARLSGDGAACALGLLRVAPSCGAAGEARIMVRPEQIEATPPSEGWDGPAGVVTGCEYFGHSAVLRVEIDAETLPALEGCSLPGPDHLVVRSLGPVVPAVGSRVALRVTGEVAALEEATGARPEVAGARSP